MKREKQMSATTSDTTTEVLASPLTINKLLIKNRIVLGPMAVLKLRQLPMSQVQQDQRRE
jgi:2,4-dienoyl-CoA reductase-like NADH-dependent reductase (Old Yellow Enzyme family)